MKNLGWIVGVVALSLLTLILFTDGCSKKHTDSVVNNSEIVELRQHLIDSVRKVSDNEKVRAIDSTRTLGKKEAARLKKKIGMLESDLQARIDSFDMDTTYINDECDYRLSVARSIIEDCQDINDTLKVALRGQELLVIQAEARDSIHLGWYQQEKADHISSDKLAADLRKELQSQNTWWKRNGKWIYGAAGLLGGILLMK